MKLSTRSRYGLRAVVELAAAYTEAPLSLAAIAERTELSESYLEQLLRALKAAGLVSSSRGVLGGYRLTKAPQELSVREVLDALEGATVVADCVGTDPNVCTNACTCSARPLFLKLQQKIHAVLDETTIQELMEDHREQMRRMEYAKNLS